MKTRIIAAFPATGKSYYHKNHTDTTIDSDSSLFSWIEVEGKKERNPEFPDNYIRHIKENIGKYEFIFVSTHEVVRKALIDNGLFFYYIVPDYCRKEEFLQRCRERGNDSNFVKLVDDNWDRWLNEFRSTDRRYCEKVEMCLDNLTDELNHIVRSENGEC